MKFTPPPLPKLPGVYIFKDAVGTILYIGKAVNLQSRVNTYFAQYTRDTTSPSGLRSTSWTIKALLDEYATISHIVTNTEHDALVLEAQLIQEYQPKYNRLLKEGNPFIYIKYTKKPYPTFSIARTRNTKGIYFGPFIHKTDARKTTRFIIDTFKLYRCGKKMAHGCLLYHIGKCSGSCLPNFDESAYAFRAELALHMLKNERDIFIKRIKEEIAEANKKLQFERAKNLHEYLSHVDSLFQTLNRYTSGTAYIPQAVTTSMPSAVALSGLRRDEALATELQTLVGGEKPIHIIDCFDISHFQSKNIVGSAIRFIDGIPDKQAFRRFMIKTLEKQNDYAALQEIVTRRYKNPADLPDLILIDGGIGQLNTVQAVLTTPLIAALAKREETLFCPAHPHGIKLDLHTDAGKTLIALRDYTHHFAITYHRLKRRIT
jgi:excinuclease ABC subunit C